MKHLDKVMYGAIAYAFGMGAGSGSITKALIAFVFWLAFGLLMENLLDSLRTRSKQQ